MQNNFNLSREEFDSVLAKQRLRCSFCGGTALKITAYLGTPGGVTVECLECNHEARELRTLEAFGTKDTLATVETKKSILNAIAMCIDKFKIRKVQRKEN